MSDWKFIEPASAKNLVENTSFETGTTGWATGGTNTIAQSADQQRNGVYSLQATYQDNTSFAFYGITLPAAGNYVFSAWIYVPASFDGTSVRVQAGTFAGSADVSEIEWGGPAGPKPKDKWFRASLVVTIDAGDLTGALLIRSRTSEEPTAGKSFYIDSVDIVTGSQISTHVDGDQQHCEWLRTPHASQSQRAAQSRAGGIERDVTDYYDLALGQINGSGDVMHAVLLDNYTLHPGGELQRVTNESRVMQWAAQFSAGTLPELHAKRQTLLRALSVDEVTTDNGAPQETRVIYTGAAIDKELDISLESGMGGVFRAQDCVMERVALSFVSAQPMWRARGDSGVVLEESEESVPLESITARLRDGNGKWDTLGPPSSGGEINTIVRGSDGSIYPTGNYINFDGIAAADRVVRRDVQAGTWHAVGAGLNGRVRGSAKAPNGDIFFVGDFDDESGGPGNTYNYIVKWDVSASTYVAIMVSGINNGLNNPAYDCAFGKNGKLYIVGPFTDVDGGPGGTYNRVIEYDPQTDSVAALGTGLAGAGVIGKAVSSNPINGHIIFGGICTTADGVSVVNVAEWTPATATVAGSFAAMGAGLAGGAVNTISTDTLGNSYAFGEFSTNFNHAARYDGQQWLAMGNGLVFDSLLPPPVIVKDSTIAPDGTVIAVGLYNKAGTIFAPGIAGWNGSDWFRFDFQSGGDIFAVLADNPDPLDSSIYDLWVGYGNSPLTFSRAAQTVATNDGTADAYPVIRIKRDGATGAPKIISIINEITGSKLLLDYNILDGEELLINTDPFALSVESNFYGVRNSALLTASDVGFFFLQPGANVMSTFVNMGATPPTVEATMYWRPRYKSFD